MSKKVIEQTKPVPKIEIFDGNDDINVIPVTHIRQKWPHRDSTDAIQVDDSTRTTVAKAIDPEYQKVIDHYEFAKRNNVETGKFIRHLKDQNAKLVEALRECQVTISEIKSEDSEYNSKVFELYRRNNLLIIQALQTLKT